MNVFPSGIALNQADTSSLAAANQKADLNPADEDGSNTATYIMISTLESILSGQSSRPLSLRMRSKATQRCQQSSEFLKGQIRS